MSPAQVDELVVLYGEGLSAVELSRKFGIYTRTAAAHLVRRSVPLRQRGLAPEDAPETVRLYGSGWTLRERNGAWTLIVHNCPASVMMTS